MSALETREFISSNITKLNILRRRSTGNTRGCGGFERQVERKNAEKKAIVSLLPLALLPTQIVREKLGLVIFFVCAPGLEADCCVHSDISARTRR